MVVQVKSLIRLNKLDLGALGELKVCVPGMRVWVGERGPAGLASQRLWSGC